MSTHPTLQTVQIYPTQLGAITGDPLGFMMQQREQAGDFIHYPLRITNAYQVTHPDLVRQILQTNNRNYNKDTIQYNTLSQITGRGLLTSDGDVWLQQRRLAQPAFHRKRLEAMATTMTDATVAMLERWETKSHAGEAIDIDEEMMQLTLEIVGKTLFNIDLRSGAHAITQAVLTTLDYVVYRASAMIAPPLWVPTPRNRKVRAALDLLDQTVYDIIAARRASGEDAGDVLSMFLQTQDEETGVTMTDAQIRDEMMTLIIAGHETVASALTWCWYLLAQHPEQREEMEAELARVLAGRVPTVADLGGLSFTSAVFDETLRLYPPAWLITRRAIEADELADAIVPARGLMILSPYVTHRHPDFWERPLAFDPTTHFLAEAAQSRPRFAYIPFGGGPRLCIGDAFALLEAKLIMGTIAQRFRLNLVPEHPIKMDALVTLRPRHGMLMQLEPR